MRTPIREQLRRVLNFERRSEVERRLDEEMRFHLDMLTERHLRSGLAPIEARRVALAEFGGSERFKDDARDEYRGRLLDELGQDVRYAARVLRRSPAFSATAVLTFALGIGASTAIFSVVHGVLLRPLPYAGPDRLVVLWEHDVAKGNDRNVVAVPAFEAWREQARSFEGMAGVVPLPATVAGSPSPERATGAEVSPGYFALLGVGPSLGRTFTADEERDGGANVVVLSDGFWRSRFGGDPGVLGRTLTINGRAHTIVGVMPRGFEPPRFAWLDEQAFWRPFGATPDNRRWGRFLLVVARMKPGVSLDVARREMRDVAARLATDVRANEEWSAAVIGLGEQMTGDVRLPLLVLLGAASLLLFMAVTNVANLTLGDVGRRAHELAVRRAIGATNARLVRQLLTQSMVVGALGCVIGLMAAGAGVRALVAWLPPEIPRVGSVRLDAPVALFAVVVGIVASVGVGLASAIRGSRDDGASIRESGARVASRLRGGSLVAAEIALGLVLAVLGGLTVRTFVALRTVDLGFASDDVVLARVGLSGRQYETPDARRRFFDELLGRLRTTPGVEAASAVSTRPFGGMAPATTLGDAGRPAAGDSVIADVRYADAGLFRTLRIPLLAGTTFDSRDALDAPPRVMVNEKLARTLWPIESAIGKRLRVPMFNGIVPEVIGVVGDVHLMDAPTPPRGTIYLAATRFPSDALDLVVRGNADASLIAAVRGAVSGLDPGVPVYQVVTLPELVDGRLARDRFSAALLSAFAVVSLLLAAVGIYGVFAADVAQRRKEIGIRVALGSSTRGVVALVMRRALGRALVGVVMGTIGALFAGRAMASLLFGVGAADPASFVGVVVLLLGIAAGATLVPALRAARVSPLDAIRTD